MAPILGITASSISGSKAITGAFESIQTITLSTAAPNITFNSIVGTYKSLQIRYLAKTSRALVNDSAKIEINGDTTTTNYRSHTLNGDGTSTYAGTTANAIEIGGFPGNTNASMFGAGVFDFLDYANTNKYKTIRTLSGFNQNSATAATQWLGLDSGLWMSSSAITSIKITPGTGANFAQYSSFALYGIKGA
jgi:hypothetical protein